MRSEKTSGFRSTLWGAIAPIRKIYRRLAPPFRVRSFETLFPNARLNFHSDATIIETPELLEFPLWSEALHLRAAEYSTPPDYTSVIPEALCCPINNVVVTKDRAVVAESIDMKKIWRSPQFRGVYQEISGHATLVRSPAPSYYHVLVDRLPRLMALLDPPYSELEKIKLLAPGGLTGLERFYLSRIISDNMEVVDVEPKGLCKVEKLVFSSFKTRRFAGYIPSKYLRRIREVFLPSRPSRRCHRIYISREKQAVRRISNRSELMDMLAARGFISVVPEALSLSDEIELFYDAEAIVGPHGSGFTNILFAEQAKVLEIYPTNFMVPHFYFLSKCLGHSYSFICDSGEDRYPVSYAADIETVRRALDDMDIS